ncbi:hypothetical protein RHAL1_01318 [Beijerinckiaceae bacterium RH AL1]|nr:hypothetical protein RHCH11_RHCH11_01287 [Beijerinckiaceae bacterium RH CH11]VVB44640.1 hypothetical protein RHAL8_01284 [Beijerinckiaceae bacterium RH AL8]VVC54420.1 hypothetical protein RHAL1_01318 [Beijerinckiaceae bacterium RH AL1]
MQKTAQEAYPLRQPSDIAEVLMHALTDPTGSIVLRVAA